MNFLKETLDFFFPEFCLVCKKIGTQICDDCISKIPIKYFSHGNIFSFYEYRNNLVNKLIWKAKYHHSHQILEQFSKTIFIEILKSDFLRKILSENNILFIPVPLNIGDRRIHNHAELFANHLARNFANSKVVSNLIIKENYKKQSHTKNKEERIQNIKNAFCVEKKDLFTTNSLDIENTFLFIIDDVTTTGSTIEAIRKLISKELKFPKERIFGLTIAH